MIGISFLLITSSVFPEIHAAAKKNNHIIDLMPSSFDHTGSCSFTNGLQTSSCDLTKWIKLPAEEIQNHKGQNNFHYQPRFCIQKSYTGNMIEGHGYDYKIANWCPELHNLICKHINVSYRLHNPRINKMYGHVWMSLAPKKASYLKINLFSFTQPLFTFTH